MTTANYSQLLTVYGRPRRVTTYTSGSGTHTLLTDGGLCTITLVGGGGGGGGGALGGGGTCNAGGGGGAGQTIARTVRLYGTQAYSVGTGGAGGAASTGTSSTVGTSGVDTSLGAHLAGGGGGAQLSGSQGIGGFGGGVCTFSGTELYRGVWCGDNIPGGAGADQRSGSFYPGQPHPKTTSGYFYTSTAAGYFMWGQHSAPAGTYDAGAGGDTVYGTGGAGGASGNNVNGTAGSAGTGYGAGGGGGGGVYNNVGKAAAAGAAGTDGLIIIEEWE